MAEREGSMVFEGRLGEGGGGRREAYKAPEWASSIPKVPTDRMRLGMFPTPLHRWEIPPQLIHEIAGSVEETINKDNSSSTSSSSSFQLFIKRDDESGALLGGNKIRKLEFLLAEAIKEKKEAVITIGGVQSNHCRITAGASRVLGLKTHLILRTETKNVEDETISTGNTLLDRMSGADIHLIPRANYSEVGQYRLVEGLKQQLLKKGIDAYPIPVGGSNAVGAWGYINAVQELKQQLEYMSEENKITDIVVATGSGGTAEGLALGVHLSGLPVKVHAICVCDDADYFYNHANDIFSDLGIKMDSREIMNVIPDYIGLGYGKAKQHEFEAQKKIAGATGVLTDPTYTGKAVTGLCHMLEKRQNEFKGKNILYWHTGGLFGVFGRPMEEIQAYWGSLKDSDHVHTLDFSDM